MPGLAGLVSAASTPIAAYKPVDRSAVATPARTGSVAGQSRYARRTGERLDDRVDRAPLGVRATPSIARHVADDETRIARAQRGGVDLEAIGHALGKVIDYDVAALGQRIEGRQGFGHLEIEHDTALVAIVGEEIQRRAFDDMRRRSPVRSPAGGSILMISAPRSPRIMVANGPASACVRWSTRTPSSGDFMSVRPR